MFWRKLYSYHVAYAHQTGFGMAEVTMTRKINNYEGIKEIQKRLEDLKEVTNIVILSFNLIGKVKEE